MTTPHGLPDSDPDSIADKAAHDSVDSDADVGELIEIPAQVAPVPLTETAVNLITDARQNERQVDCFDFVPSNYENAWSLLSSLPRARFCEWGSGMGVVTGLAAILGFDACGIELDEALAEQSRQRLNRHKLSARILCASYFDIAEPAEVYYVYAWPGEKSDVEQLFLETAPPGARLLICYGQDDLRMMQRRPQP